MPLEATMFCVDNSGYMRNGDYSPTRLGAQSESVHVMASAKLRNNVESKVALMSLAGSRVDVLISLTSDIGKFLTALKSVQCNGTCDIVTGLKIAQLTLKNRPNKSQRQRIVLFVGSPIQASANELSAIGKQLKKNNVAVDVIHIGTENSSNDNSEKLQALISAVNSDDNSHLLNVPPGPHKLSDMIVCSDVMAEAATTSSRGRVGGPVPSSSANIGAGTGSSGMNDIFGVNAEEDPELAFALRMSMEEEEKNRTRAATQASLANGNAGSTSTTSTTTTTTTDTTSSSTAATSGNTMNDDDDLGDDMDEELRRAIALSLELNQDETSTPASAPSSSTTTSTTTVAGSTIPATPATSTATTRTAPNAPSKEDVKSSNSTTTTDASGSDSLTDMSAELMDNPDFLASLLAEAGYDASLAEEVANATKDENKGKDGKPKDQDKKGGNGGDGGMSDK